MKIVYYQGECPNFGDDLNLWLWPKILPNFFDEREDTYFIGIGLTIGLKSEEPAKKIVFGAGFVPMYHFIAVDHAATELAGQDWHVYFVRGPRTAKLLNLSPELAIADPAVLVRTILEPPKRSPDLISFIPHWQSLDRGNWEMACGYAGINLIDPRSSIDVFLDGLLRSRLVIAEAMHGAIVADALRVPWVPVVPIQNLHREKWFDWADSLDISLKSNALWPSSIEEARMLAAQTRLMGNLRKAIKRERTENGVAASLLRSAGPREPVAPSRFDKEMAQLAARRLNALSRIEPVLSPDASLDRAINRILDKVQQLRKDYDQ